MGIRSKNYGKTYTNCRENGRTLISKIVASLEKISGTCGNILKKLWAIFGYISRINQNFE